MATAALLDSGRYAVRAPRAAAVVVGVLLCAAGVLQAVAGRGSALEPLVAVGVARVNDLSTARRLAVEPPMPRGPIWSATCTTVRSSAWSRCAMRSASPGSVPHAVRSALSARLADADRAAEQALADLRELAHGISPAALDVEGLADAVRSAAERAPGPVTIVELPAERLPEPVERAAYRLIADFLREMPRRPPLACPSLCGERAATSSSS